MIQPWPRLDPPFERRLDVVDHLHLSRPFNRDRARCWSTSGR
jgi:hypothetical protein